MTTLPTGTSLRFSTLQLLMLTCPLEKAKAVRQLVHDLAPEAPQFNPQEQLTAPPSLPGRPARPRLVHPSQLKNRSVGTLEGRAALIHSLAHIEANAINLALDLVWRFDGMPERFYADWLQVAREEALHFQLLHGHLQTLGYSYGDFPAHDGLWEMAEKTQSDLLARLALVPRTLEARGLDVTPAIQTKLTSVGDRAGVAILDVILRDEIGHVAVGNHWYRHLCALRQLDPIQTYASLAATYGARALQGPFNLVARRAAGFDEAELAELVACDPRQA